MGGCEDTILQKGTGGDLVCVVGNVRLTSCKGEHC